MSADLDVIIEALESRAIGYESAIALGVPWSEVDPWHADWDPAARAAVLRRKVAEIKGLPVPEAKSHSLDAIALQRALSLFGQLYGEEDWPRAPRLVREVLSHALDISLGIVAWPSDEATAAEKRILDAGAGRFTLTGGKS